MNPLSVIRNNGILTQLTCIKTAVYDSLWCWSERSATVKSCLILLKLDFVGILITIEKREDCAIILQLARDIYGHSKINYISHSSIMIV
jgi:hypothetical protein